MKKLLLVLLTAVGISTQVSAYDITVDNTTGWRMRIEIRAEGSCGPNPNGGAWLEAKTKDFWPTHNSCRNIVTFHYPDGSDASAVADGGALGSDFQVYKRGDEYHWKRVTNV